MSAIEGTGSRGKARKGGKKNRKFGRGMRSPGSARYNAEKRWEKNKERKIAKQARKEAKAKERKKLREEKKDD